MATISVPLLSGLSGMENSKSKYSLHTAPEKIHVFRLIVNILFKYNVHVQQTLQALELTPIKKLHLFVWVVKMFSLMGTEFRD